MSDHEKSPTAESDEASSELFLATNNRKPTSESTTLGTRIHLPRNRKFPPPAGVTGWKNLRARESYVFPADHDGNIGLVLADGVVMIDVDQYGEKRGVETMRARVRELGGLPDTWMNTRRDPETGGGHYLFRVPVGTRLHGDVGAGVEILQAGHRYAVVAPSVVDGQAYRWYGPDLQPCDEPTLEQLPYLPAAWLEGLRNGAQPEPLDVIEFADGTGALEWLEATVHGFREPMTPALKRALSKLSDDAVGGAHDAMNDAVYEIVVLGAEGHEGVGLALEQARKTFCMEVLGGNDGEARRDLASADAEWTRSLTGAIAKLRAELDSGHRQISPVGLDAASFDIDLDAFREGMAAAHPDAVRLVDAEEYPDNDTGRARMMLDMLDGRLIAVTDLAEEWMFRKGGRWRRMNASRAHAELWDITVTRALETAARRVWAQHQDAQERGRGDADDLKKKAGAYFDRAKRSGDLAQITKGVSMAHKIASGYGRSVLAFDADPHVLGADNGIVDIAAYCASGDVDDLLRPATPDDLVSESIGFDFDPHARSARLERYLDLFLPSGELQRDVFRVIGAMLGVGNAKRIFPVAKGPTSTGKSTLLRFMLGSLGSYAGSAKATDFFAGGSGPSPEVLDALRRRVVTMSETNTRVTLHGDTVKGLTGDDEFSGRYLYSNTVIRQYPRFTPILVTNQLPTITEPDDAVFRRLVVLPFTRQHKDQVDEAPLTDEDRSHFLRLMIEGYRDGQQNKWAVASDLCAEIAEATTEAFAELDPFIAWTRANLREDPTAKVADRIGSAEAWDAYLAQCKTGEITAEERLTITPFRRRMKSLFGDTESTGGRRIYKTPIVLRGNTESE